MYLCNQEESVQWKYDESTKVLTIFGNGPMADYEGIADTDVGTDNDLRPWKPYLNQIAEVHIEEDGELGQVFVSGIDSDKCKRAIEIINTIAVDPEPGAMYLGKVTRIMDFGAFVEIAPGKEGLVHISQLDVKRTENVTDVVNVGDIIRVKVMEIDDKGRLNLSRRQVLIDVDGLVPENDIDAERAARPRRPHQYCTYSHHPYNRIILNLR